ncbi:MAG: hypothetical protein NTV02_00810 [Candidatus Zambryskibacteria bacterium]|nr:hypothetical protein [Candidatus Zambryskibacteria bacterium]
MRTDLSHLKQKAIALRLEGNSYGNIKKTLGLKSKGTLSVWFRDVILPEDSRKKLEKNNLLAIKRGLSSFNNNRTARIKIENELAYKKGSEGIPENLNKRDLLLVGVALYWAEGTKAINKVSPAFSFSNSDPEMVRVFMRFIREILLVKEEVISGGIHVYSNTDVVKAKNFWGNVTNLHTLSLPLNTNRKVNG